MNCQELVTPVAVAEFTEKNEDTESMDTNPNISSATLYRLTVYLCVTVGIWAR